MKPERPGPRWETPDPPGVRGTYGDAVIRWAKRKGITPGWWQSYIIRKALRYDRAGDVIARIILFSTGRQNGKSVIVRAITGWMLDEGQYLEPFQGWTTMLAAAHDARQARIIYNGLGKDIEQDPERKAKTRVTTYRGISSGHIDFDIVTSQPGSARGWSAGLIDWDEMLTQRDWAMWEALGPTQSAQRSPMMLLTSTAGHADSVVLRALYDRLLRQASGDEEPDPTFYAAWWQSQDASAGLEWDQIRQANPALGDGRLTEQAIRSEHALLPPESWQRERLNHFVDVRVAGAFAPGVWAQCKLPKPLEGVDPPYALGIDVQPGWERATIAVAGRRTDGRIGVEVYKDIRSEVTAERLVREVEAFPDPVQTVAYDTVSGAAAAFTREVETSPLPWEALKPGAMVDACMDAAQMIISGKLAVDDPLLDAQIAWTARRNVGTEGAFRFSRTHSAGPIDGIIAMTLAAHAIAYRAKVPSIYV